MKGKAKKAFELKTKLDDIFKQYAERTKCILSHQELIDKVNYRKRSINSLVAKNGIKKPICIDGILFRGKFEYIEDHWTRKSNGHEILDYLNSFFRVLAVTKDSNEGVGENDDTTNLGVEWDIKTETLRNNKSEEICINATFAKNYMRVICILMMYRSHSENEILEILADIDRCRSIWENAPIARINLKKQPGNGSINDSLLSSYISLYEDVLRKQIELINPTVIINSAGKPGMKFFKKTYKDLECIDKNYGNGRDKWIYADKNKRVIIIDIYHFSNRGWEWNDRIFFKELLHRLIYASMDIDKLLMCDRI